MGYWLDYVVLATLWGTGYTMGYWLHYGVLATLWGTGYTMGYWLDWLFWHEGGLLTTACVGGLQMPMSATSVPHLHEDGAPAPDSPDSTPDCIPGSTPGSISGSTPDSTSGNTPDSTPGCTPDSAPDSTPGT